MDETETVATEVAEVISDAVVQAVAAEQRAEETAEAIALAAIETERGRRVADLEERVNQCQTTLNSLPEMLAAQTVEAIQSAANSLRAELSAEMNSLLSAAVAGLANPNHPSLTSVQPEPVPVEVVEVTAEEPPTPEPVPSESPPAVKKRHRFL
jgi:hypothetical protein